MVEQHQNDGDGPQSFNIVPESLSLDRQRGAQLLPNLDQLRFRGVPRQTSGRRGKARSHRRLMAAVMYVLLRGCPHLDTTC